MHRVKLKGPYMVNSYHQKTFTILKLIVMSKLNVKILQCKYNIWKGNYKTCIEQCLFKKWQRWMTICCLKTFRQYWNRNEGDHDVDERSSDNEEMKKIKPLSSQNATFCFISKSIHDNYKKSKFDEIQIV